MYVFDGDGGRDQRSLVKSQASNPYKGWSSEFLFFAFIGNISIKSSQNLKSKASFEICSFSAFQNCPYFWILTNLNLSKLR